MAPILTRNSTSFGFSKRRGPSGPSLSVTGGTVYNPGNGYIYNVFTYPNTQSLTISGAPGDSGWAYVLMVAGGGGGGSNAGPPGAWCGGGAAGGLLTGQLTLTNGTYPISVGNGGAGGSNSPGSPPGTPGQPTTAFGATANGGGGAPAASPPSAPGGSTSQSPSVLPYGTLTGYAGNGAPASGFRSGGGGGAGGNGGNSFGGVGRSISWMEPTLGTPGPSPGRWFGGGGGGAAGSGDGGPWPGGAGGGGVGASNPARDASAGTPGTGGGGGGGNTGPEGSSKPGGSGIVVVAYPVLA